MKRAERHELAGVIRDVRGWLATAEHVRFLAAHPPLSREFDLGGHAPLLTSLVNLAQSGDLETAVQLSKRTWFSGAKDMPETHDAAHRIRAFHSHVVGASADGDLLRLRDRLTGATETERTRLGQTLTHLTDTRATVEGILDDLLHMPISRTGVVEPADHRELETLVRLVDLHAADAGQLLDPSGCLAGTCGASHQSARILRDLSEQMSSSPLLAHADASRQRVAERRRAETEDVRLLAAYLPTWETRAETILTAPSRSDAAVNAALRTLLAAAIDVDLETRSRLVPLNDGDTTIVAQLTFLRDYTLTDAQRRDVSAAVKTADRISKRIATALDASGRCRPGRACVDVHDAMGALARDAEHADTLLDKLTPPALGSSHSVDDLVDPTLALARRLPSYAGPAELVTIAQTKRARSAAASVLNAAKAEKAAASAAKAAGDRVHAGDVTRALKAMDLEVLRKATTDRLRVSALSNGGLDNAWDVLRYAETSGLTNLPGLGAVSAVAAEQAARRLFEAVREETPIRIDVRRRDKDTTELLKALRRWDSFKTFTPNTAELSLARGLTELFKANPSTSRILTFGISGADSASAASAIDGLVRRTSAGESTGDVWQDFLSRPADYFGMLTELGFITEDEQKMHGDLPEDIIEAVRALELKRDHLTASLRTYQSFGARFALVQEKVVIGDEMGLGKTVEALAALTHLRSLGHTHFVVVCPAAVVSNWIRETSKHTTLSAHRVHGPLWERSHAAKAWRRNGGIAVTTYDLLRWADEFIGTADVAGAVFDEAHYIKNPLARRSIAASDLIEATKYVILMTGTPLENNVQEFRNLVGYIRPDLSDSAPEYLASKFRKHMAPAYLRRNQEDVLTELPEVVEIDEWMGMSDSDEAAYRSAVQSGKFMLMRRTAMLSERSLKVERLREIVEEAESNGRRVIVFSYFREVLDQISGVLPGRVFGPLTGSIPARDRQTLIDRFSEAPGGAVLVAQITAGGVGLNIQSASVVVICEPQIKPTMEAQAIARAHRMGQTNTVQVHRLLSENSVDERVREILADKKKLFDEFARDSVIADRAPDAVDVTDAELARVVIAAERERLFGQAGDEPE